MYTDAQREAVHAVLEKKRADPNYRPSPEEQNIIDAVLQTSIDSLENVSTMNQAIFNKVVRINPIWGFMEHASKDINDKVIKTYTVGFFDPNSQWKIESTWNTPEEAEARVHFLNAPPPRPQMKSAARYGTIAYSGNTWVGWLGHFQHLQIPI